MTTRAFRVAWSTCPPPGPPLTLAALAEGAAFAVSFPLGDATIGLVLSLRRPANPIGWLYAASGLAWSLMVPLDPWVDQLVREGRPLPLAAQLAAVAGSFLWAPGVAFGITLPFLLLPGGRLRSPGWRVVVVTAVTGAGIVLAAGSLLPGRLEATTLANPFALAGPAGTVATVLFDAGLALHAASAVAALVSLVLQFRAARGVERQQLRWVAAGGAAALAGLLPTILVGLGIAPRVNDLVVYPAVLCVPVAVAVAVLRYRLWDLDRLVSRTVTYTLVSGLLVLPYLLIVMTISRGVRDSPPRSDRPGRSHRRAARRGRADATADPRVALAAPANQPAATAAAVVTGRPQTTPRQYPRRHTKRTAAPGPPIVRPDGVIHTTLKSARTSL